jgi:hypothetical protein
VRYYLLFIAVGPLLVGFAGLNSKSFARPLLATLVLGAAGVFALSYTNAAEGINETFDQSFNAGTNQASMDDKARGGSGVTFNDGGNPFGQLHLKILYTLLSPFPWQSGSVGLQIGKIDAVLWYIIAYHAVRAGRRLMREDRTLLLMFVSFILPMTIMYAVGMANIGLAVRQRLPIVLTGALLAAIRYTVPVAAKAKVDEPADTPGSSPSAHPTASEA